MKKPSQKRDVFRGPQKSCQNHIFRGSLRQSRPKNKILNRFAIFLGSRNGTKKSADTGRCQAFQIREASISEAPPSEACPPYLPASIWIIKLAPFRDSFSASNFGLIFGMPFVPHVRNFGVPLAPLWLLWRSLDAFWAPFWVHFGSLLHHFGIFFLALFLHRLLIDFWMIFGTPDHVKKRF